MDSFEAVIAAILQRQGYWTQTSLKVNLTKEEKRAIGRYSSPRWELDVVGYRGATDELLILECKSFLDSLGVQCATFEGKNSNDSKRYKLFFEDNLRTVVGDTENDPKSDIVGQASLGISAERCLNFPA